MIAEVEKLTLLISKVWIKPEALIQFADWQAELNAAIAVHPGFVSLEILSPSPEKPEWSIIQRFQSHADVESWCQSETRKRLMEALNAYTLSNQKNIQDQTSVDSRMPLGITEVFVTQVSPENEKAYREWIAKIHQAEAKFPGFRGVYMQSPGQSGGVNWITLLQFDTPEHLDFWLNSQERQKVLSEAKPLISSLESHRMISPYAGWFASLAKGLQLPPVWKQTMIVLLVLYPIVMLELKYLSPLTAGLNSSVGTFIGNAISVTLIAWPMMPIAIWFLGWWLTPKPEQYRQATIWGTCLMGVLYFLEIALFWYS